MQNGIFILLTCFPPMPLISNFSWPSTTICWKGGKDTSKVVISCPPASGLAALGPPSEKQFCLFSERFSELSSHPWRFRLRGRPSSSHQGLYSRLMGKEPNTLASLYHDNYFVSLTNFAFFSYINQSNISSPNPDTGDSL